MSAYIAQHLKQLNIQINKQHIDNIAHQLAVWELRQQHPLALNSQLIGVHPISFTDSDRQQFFHIFELDEKTVWKIIQVIPSVNTEFKVSSDTFNIFAVWLLHLGYTQIIDEKLKHQFLFTVSKLLHYKYFTSLVNHFFQHGANEKIMTATINSLSKKFDIVVYGTWRLAIEARCKDLIAEDSIHHRTIQKADDDKAFLYVLTDTQTRMRDRIKNITTEYYNARERGDKVDSRAAVGEDLEGEKMLVHTASSLDALTNGLAIEVQTERLFIHQPTINLIVKRFNNVSADMLRTTLRSMSELATSQVRSKQLDLVKRIDGQDIYIGMRALLTNLIQKSYRYCINNHVDMNNRGAIFLRILNVYSSSRIADKDILSVKESVSYLVDSIGSSKRETTKASLRLAVILYCIVRSFEHL